MHFWIRTRTSSRWTGCLLILLGMCVLVWGVNARLRQYRSPATSLAASLMLLEQDERGGVVVTEGERFRSPLESACGCWSGAALEESAGEAAVPAWVRTSEAARLPAPPILFELFMRPPPPTIS
jgi:hypothetical protein